MFNIDVVQIKTVYNNMLIFESFNYYFYIKPQFKFICLVINLFS